MTVYLEGGENSMKRPEVLKAIEAVERVAQQQPIVTSALSLADLVSDTNQAFFAGKVEEHHVPDSDPLISQYLSMVDPGDLSEFVTSDYSRSHIRILIADHGSRTVRELRDLLQTELDARFPPLGIRATITGYGVVSYYDWDHAVVEVLWGFVLAFSLITALEFIIFRSIRIALFSVIPNLVPVAASFLVMRALNLNLRLDSSIVLCISVGGLFNTTIHIAARVMQQVRAGARDPDAIVGRALAAVGPPSLYTAVVLSLGFAVLGLSRFPGLKMLGLLCVVTLMTGFVADATITTTLFRWFFNWKRALHVAVEAPSPASLARDRDAAEEEVVS
jgi:predicted RND superfamily exporter protein